MQPFALEDTDRDRAVLVLVDDELADMRVRRRVDGENVASMDADVMMIGFGDTSEDPPTRGACRRVPTQES